MSSGLDSASIGVLAARLLEKERKNLYTYTYVPYENETHTAKNLVTNEESDVRRIASQYPNMKLTFLNNSGKKLLRRPGSLAGCHGNAIQGVCQYSKPWRDL